MSGVTEDSYYLLLLSPKELTEGYLVKGTFIQLKNSVKAITDIQAGGVAFASN